MTMQADPNNPAAESFGSMAPASAGKVAEKKDTYAFLLPPVEPDEIGRLGTYRVLRLLGRGGMAYVFLAEDNTLRRRVALKVMDPSLSTDADAAPRFLREARIMAAIKHDHLVTVYQVGQEGKVVYLAMELLEGEPLEAWMSRCPRPDVGEIVRLGREMASGLDVIHRNGLIHRDIKPGNIWLEAPGMRVKILDFGLARHIDDDAHLTQTGMVMGTPAFMAPEQARAEQVDARSDLFSFGCILYCLCTGTKPFQGPNTLAILTALAVDHPRHVRECNPAIPAELGDLVMALLAKKPDQRPASAAVVLALLSQCNGSFADTLVRAYPAGQTPAAGTPPTNPTPPSATRVLSPGSTPSATMPKPGHLSHPWLRWGFPAALAAVAMLVLVLKLLPSSGGSSPSKAITASQAKSTGSGVGVGPTGPVVAGKTFLSDMQEINLVNWPFKGPLPGHEDGPPPKGGGRVRYKNMPSPHGIFMHANVGPPGSGLPMEGGNVVSVSYRLGKAYRQFHVVVTLNDGPPGCEPMVFVVYGNGKERWRSKEVTGQAQTQSCDLAINDVDLLKLEVQYSGDPRGAHAAWVEPYVEK
jgi:serine/threonine protein kinase